MSLSPSPRSQRTAFFLLLFSLFSFSAYSAYLKDVPTTLSQPDGAVIHCFVSGDEFYNWVHDKDGYTIIQAPNGYYYYAVKEGDLLKPSSYLVNRVDPSSVGLIKWVKISQSDYQSNVSARTRVQSATSGLPQYASPSGMLNNLVIYIRFSDDEEFSITRQEYDNKFNQTVGMSLSSYFKEVSYNKLTINSTHYPACALTTNLSYKDTQVRNYYKPYNATTNTIGYTSNDDKRNREHTLLKNAITWINSNSPVPTTLNIDGDGDTFVDNVCFIVRDRSGDWNDLLWGHRWTLYSKAVYINGKRVKDYTFQPENQTDVRTLCHEMFHVIGAPDLYHYEDQGVINPVGYWDLMEYGSGHMSAYMKWKYSRNSWIETIPEITSSGTYTLQALTSATNNCYKIASPNSADEYFVVEYRKKTGTYESYIPGSGLLVYRIDTRVVGNSKGPPDEVYVYRPGGTTAINGNYNKANFSSTVGRTAINNFTDPRSFLQSGMDAALNISSVTASESTISFTVTIGCTPPTSQASAFTASELADNAMTLSWSRGNGNSVLVVAREDSAVSAHPLSGSIYTANENFGLGSQIGEGNFVVYNGTGTSCNVASLNAGTSYYYAIYEYFSETQCYLKPSLTGTAKTTGISMPYCESSGSMELKTGITSVSFNTIKNASLKPAAYNDYTRFFTTVTKKSTHNLTVKLNTDGPYEIHALAWIDWNRDRDFSEENEVYDLGKATNVTDSATTLSPLSITIPETAIAGITRMRIAAKYESNPTLCEKSFDGEVEDYSIVVIEPPVGIKQKEVDNSMTIYQNTSTNELTIEYEGTTNFELINMMGQSVYNGYLNKKAVVQLSGFPSGVYLIKYVSGKSVAYKKFIKK